MDSIQVLDKIKCIDNADNPSLTLGKIYVCLLIDVNNEFLTIINDQNTAEWYFTERFIKINAIDYFSITKSVCGG